MNSAEPVQPVYVANLYQPVICCHTCSCENMALLYNKNTLHKIEFATWKLLKQIKFTANETIFGLILFTELITKFQRRMKKKSYLYFLCLKIHAL